MSQWGCHARDMNDFSDCCNPVSFALMTNVDFVTADRGTVQVRILSQVQASSSRTLKTKNSVDDQLG